MFDSVAFNVVIGMVFIYLLYSLLTTILTELISAWLDMRSKTLEDALKRMLDDSTKVEEGLWKGEILWRKFRTMVARWKGGRNASKIVNPRGGQSFADRFYAAPAIKYLSSGRRGYWSPFGSSKPAYVSREFFARTLVHMFREKGAGASDFEKIRFCLTHNTLGIDPETLKHLQNLLADAGNDFTAFTVGLEKWFDETMDRATGWFKSNQRWISFLVGFGIAVALNVDSIRIVKILSKDPAARNHLVEMGIAFSKDSAKASYIMAHSADSVKKKAVIDSSFNLIQSDLDDAKLTLGLGWDFSKVQRSYCEETDITSEQLVLLMRVELLSDSIATSVRNLLLDVRKDSNTTSDSLYKARQNALALLRKELKLAIDQVNQSLMTSFNSITHVSPPLGMRPSHVTVSGTADGWLYQKAGFVLSTAWHSSTSFWGWILTALALSLGAPFWFDLLQKLVSLRGTGVKPDQQKGGTTNQSSPDIQPTGPQPAQGAMQGPGTGNTGEAAAGPPSTTGSESPVEVALRIYGERIRAEQGVLNVGAGYFEKGGEVTECLEVHTETENDRIRLASEYLQFPVGNGVMVPVSILATGLPRFRVGIPAEFVMPALAISNRAGANGWGTATCRVEDTFNKSRFIFSCFHVLNGDSDFHRMSTERDIIHGSSRIATLDRGFLTQNLDFALARIDELPADLNAAIPAPRTMRQVDKTDILKTSVVIRGAASGAFHGKIVHDNWAAHFAYEGPDDMVEDRFFNNLIKISHIDTDGTLSSPAQPGDSGAIVVDENGSALAWVVGSDNMFTYAFAINPLLENLTMKIV